MGWRKTDANDMVFSNLFVVISYPYSLQLVKRK